MSICTIPESLNIRANYKRFFSKPVSQDRQALLSYDDAQTYAEA